METIEVRCPNGHAGRMPSGFAGRAITCKKCGSRFQVEAGRNGGPPAGPPGTITPETAAGMQDVGVQKGMPPGLLAGMPPLIPVLARLCLIAVIAVVTYRFYQALSLWAVLVLLWVIAKVRTPARSDNPGGVYGSARWAGYDELERLGMIGPDGLLLGRAPAVKLGPWKAAKGLFVASLRHSDMAVRLFVTIFSGGLIRAFRNEAQILSVHKLNYVHLLTVAPAGAGKGVGVIIPNLLNYEKSVVVMDPKGENFTHTWKARHYMHGNQVVCLDPFGVTRPQKPNEALPEVATFNPFDLLDAKSPTLIDDVRALADALVVKTDKDTDPHWNEQAATFVSAVILLVACHANAEERNLNMVRRILSSKKELEPAIQVMLASTVAGGMLRRLGGQMESLAEKEFSSVLSSANRHTNFLDSPLVAASVKASSFNVNDLAKKRISIFLVLPPQYLRSHARLVRLWINCILQAVKNQGASEKDEVLFILDEVAQLGSLEPLEDAVTLLRGYGIRLWFFLQSLSQLKVCFPGPRAEVLLSNFSVQQFFGVADLETAKHISTLVGKTTATAVTNSRGESTNTSSGSSSGPQGGGSNSSSGSGSNTGTSAAPIERDLIRPEEVLRDPDAMFVFPRGGTPIRAARLTYFRDTEFIPSEAEELRTSRTAYAICALTLIAAVTLFDWNKTAAAVGLTSSQTFVVECSRCHRQGPLPVEYFGKRIRCTHCRARLQIPLPTSR